MKMIVKQCLIALGLVSMAIAFDQSDCSADPGSKCIQPDDKLPDDNDCFKFYWCLNIFNSTINSLQCPKYMYFDTDLLNCTYSSIPGKCDNNVCTSNEPKGCTKECDGEKFYVADLTDCSVYHTCSPPTPQSLTITCAYPDLYFDGSTCTNDSSKCCNFCDAYCTKSASKIVDPCDCTSYFVCTDIGPANVMAFKGQCESGKYFDETSQNCMVGSCQNECTTALCDTTTLTTNIGSTTSPRTTTASSATSPLSSITTTKNALTTTPIAITSAPKTTLTSAKTITSATTITSLPPCDETATCVGQNDGSFPRCSYCDPRYYTCRAGVLTNELCTDSEVFNTDPAYPYCIVPSMCPYNP